MLLKAYYLDEVELIWLLNKTFYYSINQIFRNLVLLFFRENAVVQNYLDQIVWS